MPITSSGSSDYSYFCLTWLQIWGFHDFPPPTLVSTICYDGSQNLGKYFTFHCWLIIIKYKLNKQLKGTQGKFWKGPECKNFSLYGVWGLPVSWHMDAFTKLEALEEFFMDIPLLRHD